MSFRFIGPLLGAALLLAGGSAQAVPPVTCSPTKLKIKVMTGTVSTSATTQTVIPGSAVTFTQGGTGPSCVVVRFSAASSVVGGGVSVVQARLGSTLAEPNEAQFSGENVGSVSHAFEFLFPSVAPGSHTVRMFFRVGNGSHTVFVDERTTAVQHAP